MTDSKPTTPDVATSDSSQNDALDAAVLRRLLAHLDDNKDVQNIDLMNLAGFCRNCLSKWYRQAAEDTGTSMELDTARERIYGMPYSEWKANHQAAATPEQQAEFDRKNSAKNNA